MSRINNGGLAFPSCNEANVNGTMGMTKREYFAGLALTNPSICDGKSNQWDLKAWFGDRSGITADEIRSKQATSAADALIAELAKGGDA